MKQILKRLTGIESFEMSPWQFSFFRIVFGGYLVIHFVQLIPFAPELFSREGLIPDASLLPTHSIFPNLLTLIDTPLGTQFFISALVLLAAAFMAGWKRTWMAVLLWYGWACLFNRNIFIGNPGLPMVGWLLLACALIPRGEPLSFDKKNSEWKMPLALFWGAWALMAVGYTVSGIHKLGSPSWVNGTAILRLLENPLARDVPWREWILEGPSIFPRLMAYSSLVMEVFFLPLAIFRFTRPWIWLGMVSMHLGILTMVNFADLTTGVLMVHLFTFDPRWIPAIRKAEATKEPKLIFFFDGVCGLCNSVVDFLMVEDRDRRFHFSPLQSESAAQWLSPTQLNNLDSSVVMDNGEILEKSAAFIRIGQHLGGIWRLFAEGARVLPKSLVNHIYDFVAKNRYRWFGQKSECRMPTKEERTRFIL